MEGLIDAFRLLDPIKSRLTLSVAGDGPQSYIDRLRSRAAGLPVKFLGHVKPGDFFPLIDLTVVPSIWNEPLGRVVIESMAFGKAVVCTPVGGMPELIKGREGVVAKDTTPLSIAAAIGDLQRRLRDDSIDISNVARARAGEFHPERIATAYLDVFDRVALDAPRKLN